MKQSDQPRILAAVRLSQLSKLAQTGVDKQDDAVKEYAKYRSINLDDILWSEDTNVSGSKSPFERPELGQWLSCNCRPRGKTCHQEYGLNPKFNQYDEIVAAKLDRFGRNARDLSELRNWAEDHGKRLKVLSPKLEWPPDKDDLAMPFLWDILARLAEAELESIRSRILETMAKLRKDGRWGGGRPIFGYRPVCECHSKRPCPNEKSGGATGWTLEPDPTNLVLVNELADRILAGESASSLSREFSRRKIPTSGTWSEDNTIWHDNTISRLLRSPAIKGLAITYELTGEKYKSGQPKREKEPTILRDEDGMPYRPFTALMSDEKWDRVQAKLDSNRRGKQSGPKTKGPAKLLSGIAFCPCGNTWYSNPNTKDGVAYDQYRARGKYTRDSEGNLVGGPVCGHYGIPVVKLDAAVDAWMTDPRHTFPEYEYSEEPGDDIDDQLKKIDAQIDQLNKDKRAGKISRDECKRLTGKLEARYEGLDATERKPAKISRKPTGLDSGQLWKAMGTDQKRQFIEDHGIEITASLRVDEMGITGKSGESSIVAAVTFTAATELDDTRYEEQVVILCPGCGERAVTKLGTCRGSSSYKPNDPCHKAYQRHARINREASNAGLPEPHKYDVDQIDLDVNVPDGFVSRVLGTDYNDNYSSRKGRA